MDRLKLLDAGLRAFDTLLPDVTPSLCLVTRYRGSTCRSCLDACPASALTVSPWLELDADACRSCGACAAVCRTGALALTHRSAAMRHAFRLTAAGSPSATLACRCVEAARAEDAMCIVPCLGTVSARDLIAAAALGIREIDLLSGDCRECPDAAAEAVLHIAVSTAEGTLAFLHRPFDVTRTHTSGCQPQTSTSSPAVSRRGLLDYVARGLERAVVGGIAQRDPERSIKSLHRQSAPPAAHRWLIEDLSTLRPRSGRSATTLPASLPLAVVTVAQECDGCGLCVRYCPHGALQLNASLPTADELRCTACGLCAEVCPTSSLLVGPVTA